MKITSQRKKWQQVPAAVSFDDDGRLDRREHYPAELALIKDEERQGNAVLSLIMDDQMQTSKAELGGYDHIVFVNDQALKLAGISRLLKSSETNQQIRYKIYDKQLPHRKLTKLLDTDGTDEQDRRHRNESNFPFHNFNF